MKTIPLTKGLVAIVDDTDFERVSRYQWHATRKAGGDIWYATRNVKIGKRKQTKIRMHRFIVGAESGVQVDHENGNGVRQPSQQFTRCYQPAEPTQPTA